MPVATPLGYPAGKRSLRESTMRAAMGADKRKDFGKLFFDEDFDTPLDKESAGIFCEALEMVRLAPSARNEQPWRILIKDGKVHFYKKSSIPVRSMGDIQKVDIGIALCHFDLTMRSQGNSGTFCHSDPGIEAPADTEYMISFGLCPILI